MARLVESRSVLLQIIDSVADPVFVKDRQHHFVMVNDALCRLMGRDRFGLLGRTDHDFVPAEEADVFRAKDEAVFATGIENVNEERLTDAHGKLHVIVTKKRLFVDERGERYIVAIVRDVTESRRIQEQLHHSQHMQMVGMLAVGVGREINDPLACVLSNLRSLWRELRKLRNAVPPGKAEELQHMFGDALSGAECVRRVVHDLHAFSHTSDEVGPVDVHKVLDLALNMAAHEIRHRARVVRNYGEILPVRGDELSLGQLAVNLLINAAQAIPPERAAENEIRVTTGMEGKDRVRIEIHDTGCGIAPEHLARIFDPFFTTKRPGSATGLGLTICHRIATALDGQITAESAVGAGSAFRVVLPAAV